MIRLIIISAPERPAYVAGGLCIYFTKIRMGDTATRMGLLPSLHYISNSLRYDKMSLPKIINSKKIRL